MKGLRLAISLLSIPRLFASLLLFPLLLSFVVVYFQLIISGVFIRALNRDSVEIEQSLEGNATESFVRGLIFGDKKPLPAIRLCVWHKNLDPKIASDEVPPSPECAPDRLDIAIRTADPQSFDSQEYVKVFNGKTERLHICTACSPDIIIHPNGKKAQTELRSIWAIGILSLTLMDDSITRPKIQAFKSFNRINQLIGERVLYSRGFQGGIKLNSLETSLAIVMNIACIVIISLWLALKAHRKVLDYFARSGALLPMVAATGKSAFYGAIWTVTLIRVGAFLLGALPLTYSTLNSLMKEGSLGKFVGRDIHLFGVWCIAIIASLALGTLIASVSDLKHRHGLLSFSYRYIPVSVCLMGSLFWAFTFIFDGSTAQFLRSVTAVIPVVGVGPILVAPVFRPDMQILILHSLLTLALFTVILKHNIQWFAAHLEEL